jgi:hypothetical protein
MRKRFFGLRLSPLPFALCSVALSLFGALLFAYSRPAEAQQSTKLPRIGYLNGQYASSVGCRGIAARAA